MHERIGVNQLDCCARDRDTLRVCVCQFASREREQRAHALAPAQHRVAHGLVQSLRRDLCCRQHALQRRLDALQVVMRPGSEVSRRRGRHS
ncbi:hypothetical protein D3C83_25660 [compost metagenome]